MTDYKRRLVELWLKYGHAYDWLPDDVRRRLMLDIERALRDEPIPVVEEPHTVDELARLEW